MSVDGRVSPSNGGMYVPGRRLMWTISSLNGDALERYMIHDRPGANVIESIRMRYPQVKAVLGNTPEMALGSSPQRVGTLNLGLE